MAKLQGLGQKLGAEVPASEIAVSPAMIEAGARAHRRSRELGMFIWEELRLVYQAMECVRRAEVAAQIGRCGAYVEARPPGYRNASEDEPERNASRLARSC